MECKSWLLAHLWPALVGFDWCQCAYERFAIWCTSRDIKDDELAPFNLSPSVLPLEFPFFSVSLVETKKTNSTCPYFITVKLLFCCQSTEGASPISPCSHSTKIRTFFFSTAQCLHMKEKPWDTCRTGDKPVVWTHFHQEEQESPRRPVGSDSCLQIQHLVHLPICVRHITLL